MAEDLYIYYTLPDGKEVKFDNGTDPAVIKKHLFKKYPESMAYKPKDTATSAGGFSPNPNPLERFATSLSGGFEHGITKLTPGFGAVVADIAGNEEALQSAGAEFAAQTEEMHRENPNIPSFKEVRSKYADLGMWSALGEMVDLTAHAAGSSLGESAIPVTLMSASALTGGVGPLVAGAGVMFTQFIADNIERAIGDGTATTEDIELHKVLASAAAQTALETFSLGVARIAPVGMINASLGKAVRAGSPAVINAANKASVEIVKQNLAQQMGAGAAAFLTTTAVETGTELGQELFERYAANETFIPNFNEQEQLDEFIEVAVQSALGSAPFSSYAGQHGFREQNIQFNKQEGFKKAESELLDIDNKAIQRKQAKAALDGVRDGEIISRIAKSHRDSAEEIHADTRRKAESDAVKRLANVKAIKRTVKDVEHVAAARNIDITSKAGRAGFQRMIYQTIGQHNLNIATASQIDQVYEKIAGMNPPSAGGTRVFTDAEASSAGQTQRGNPESVMDRVTAQPRAGEKLGAVLGDLLEHVGDIAHRAQEPGGRALINVEEKLRKVERFFEEGNMSLDDEIDGGLRSTVEWDLMKNDPELFALDNNYNGEREAAGMTTRSDVWAVFRDRYANEIEAGVVRSRENMKRPLGEYRDAHVQYNNPVTEMGQIGKDMAIAIAELDLTTLQAKAVELRAMMNEIESANTQAKKESIRLRGLDDRSLGTPILLPQTTVSEVARVAQEIEREQSKNANVAGGLYNVNLTRDQLRNKVKATLRKLNREQNKKNEDVLFAGKDHEVARADAIMAQMDELQLALEVPRVRQGKKKIGPKRYRVDVSSLLDLKDEGMATIATQAAEAASKSVRIKQDSQGNSIEIVGQYPSHEELNDIVGRIDKSTYDTVRNALLKRGVIEERKRGQYFYAGIPDALSNRTEYDSSRKVVSQWVVRDRGHGNGQVVYQSPTKQGALDERKGQEAKLRPPVREKGYVIRESRFSDIEGDESKLVKAMPVAFVPDGDGALALLDQRLGELRRTHEKIRSEYLGSQGDVINLEPNPEFIREARRGDQDRALTLALRDPYESNAVLDRYHMGLEENDPARQNYDGLDDYVDRFSDESQFYIPLGITSKDGPGVRSVVKNGAYDPVTKRGFGKARMDIEHPGWEFGYVQLMETLAGFNLRNQMSRLTGGANLSEYGAPAFGPNGRYTAHAEGAGRTVIADAEQDVTQYWVMDYINENDEQIFHLYNHFNENDSYQDMIEDTGPLQGHPLYRGDPKPESVRVSENPDHKSVRKLSPAEELALEIRDPKHHTVEQWANANHEVPGRPPGQSVFHKVGRMFEHFWGEGTYQRLRELFLDRNDYVMVGEDKIRDRHGMELMAEVSAGSALRTYARISDITWESLENGYVEAVNVPALGDDGTFVDEGAQVLIAREHTLVNETKPMLTWNPNTQEFERNQYSYEAYKESNFTSTGGLLNALRVLTPTELAMLNEYNSALRSHNLRIWLKESKPGEKPLVTLTPELEQKYLQHLDNPESGAKIAVVMQNVLDLNEKVVDFLVKTHVVSEEKGKIWLRDADFISFYRDFESPGKQKYKKKHEQERIQLGTPDSMYGDLAYQREHRAYEGFEIEEEFDNEIIDQTEARLHNIASAYAAGSVNVARTRIIRNEMTLGRAREIASKEDAHSDETPVRVRVHGEDTWFVLDDEHMFAVLEHELDNKLAQFLRNHKYLSWLTTKPTQALRDTITNDPSFAVPNSFRDSTAVGFFLYNDPKMVLESMKQLFDNVVGDYKAYQKHHGPRHASEGHSDESKILAKNGIVAGIDQTASHHDVQSIVKAFKERLAGKEHGKMVNTWRNLRRFSFLSESAAREVVYKHTLVTERDRLRTLGKYSEEDIEIVAQAEAMHQAKEILNFSTRGQSEGLAAFTASVPFISAMLQGNDVLARTAFKFRRAGFDNTISDDQRAQNMLRRAGHLFIMAAILEMINVGDDEYESQSQYKRDTNYFLPIPGFASAFVTFPAPHGIGPFIKGFPQLAVRDTYHAATDNMGKAERETLKGFLAFMTSGFDGGSKIPTILKPIYQWGANKTLWGGMDIDKFWQMSLPAKDRYTSRTTSQSRALGQVTGLSPQKLDATIDAMLGGLGTLSWETMDAILRAPAQFIDEWPVPLKPMIQTSDFPIVNRFLITQEGNQHNSDHYDLRKEINEGAARLRMAQTPAEEARVRREYRPLTVAAKQLAGTNKRVAVLDKEAERVRANPGNKYNMWEIRRRLNDIKRQKNKLLERSAQVQRQLDKRR